MILSIAIQYLSFYSTFLIRWHTVKAAQSAGAVECTDCTSAEG